MSKKVKDLMTREYHDAYTSLDNACVVSVVGMDAISTNKLRGELKAKNIKLKVLKNRLARRAMAESRLLPLGKALNGPCALVTGGDSIIDVAKLLVEVKKNYPKLELKDAILEGDASLLTIEEMAKLKSRAEMLGEVAMLIASPGRRLAGCLASPGGKIAGCIKALIEKQEKAEPATAG